MPGRKAPGSPRQSEGAAVAAAAPSIPPAMQLAGTRNGIGCRRHIPSKSHQWTACLALWSDPVMQYPPDDASAARADAARALLDAIREVRDANERLQFAA